MIAEKIDTLRKMQRTISQEHTILDKLIRQLEKIKRSFVVSPEEFEDIMDEVVPLLKKIEELASERKSLKSALSKYFEENGQKSLSALVQDFSEKWYSIFFNLEQDREKKISELKSVNDDCSKLVTRNIKINENLLEILVPYSTYDSQGRSKIHTNITILNQRL